MEIKEAIFNDKKINIITKLDENKKDDYVLIDEDLSEDTIDLSNIIEETQRINVSGDING